MNEDPIVVRALLACYPAGWRGRYGDEYAALLSDHLASTPRRPALIADALRGALDARLHPLGVSMPRTPITTAIRAIGVFTVAGIGFQKLTEDQGFAAGGERHPAVGWSFNLLVIASMIALAAIVVAALPTATAMVRGRANGAWPYVAVPFVAFAAWYGVLRLAFLLTAHHSVHSARNILVALIVIVAGLGVVAATAWAAGTVLARVPATMPPRLRRMTLAVLATAMAVTTAAGIVWGIAVRAADPSRFASRDGVLASPFIPSWIVTIVIMAAATALAVHAARRESSTAVPA